MSSTNELSSTAEVGQITLSAAIPGRARGLVVVGSGTVTGTTASNTAVTDFPVFEGYNKIRFSVITAKSAGVTDLWYYV